MRRFAPLLLLATASLACGGDDAPPPPDLVYVAIGDSTGAGVTFNAPPFPDLPPIPAIVSSYAPRLADRLEAETGRSVELRNLSVPTAQAADALRVQVPQATRFTGVDLVTVCVGANDAGGTLTAEQFGATMAAIFEGLAPLGAAVVACNLPDTSLTPYVQARVADLAAFRAQIVAFNAALQAAADARTIPVVDLFAESQRLLTSQQGLVSADGFHPTAAGYAIWADILWPAFSAAAATR
jgi:lysophospholipase L1-like esterase